MAPPKRRRGGPELRGFATITRERACARHGVQLVQRRRLTFSEILDRLADQRYEQFKAVREAKEARAAAWRSRYGPPRERTEKRQCGAKTRRGTACIRKALKNGRCPNHGGLSTGPITTAGRKRIGKAQKRRWKLWREEGG